MSPLGTAGEGGRVSGRTAYYAIGGAYVSGSAE